MLCCVVFCAVMWHVTVKAWCEDTCTAAVGHSRQLCMLRMTACGCIWPMAFPDSASVQPVVHAVCRGTAASRVTPRSWAYQRQRACTAMSASVAAPDPPVQTEKVGSAAAFSTRLVNQSASAIMLRHA